MNATPTWPTRSALLPATILSAMFLCAAVLCGSLACSSTAERTCLVNADCASGVCGPGGQCVAPDIGSSDGGEDVAPRFQSEDAASDSGAAQADDASHDAGAGTDTGTNNDSAAEPDNGSTTADSGTPITCKPDHNGTIERHEAPYGANLQATFRIATNVQVSSAGKEQADGSRVWDFGGAMTGDHDAKVKTLAVKGTWFAKHFAGATYAAQFVEDDPLLGVFELTSKALLLRGVVSPDDGLLATRLTYDPPVEVLAFPLKADKTWQRKATVTGLANGVMALATETYASKVDAHGIAKTPFGNFPVLRVSTLLDRQVGLLKTRLRTQLFAAECFGTVASLRSHSGEESVDFVNAAELRRLTP